MGELIKGKFFTVLTVIITLILAGVAVFTAIRLYQLRQESVSPVNPESEPAAWDCRNYVFSVDASGIVSVSNTSTRNEPPQKAQVFIDNQLVATFDVPALPTGQNATLGTVSVPTGTFSWKVIGTLDCQNSGTVTSGPIACKQLKFTITTTTVSPTISITTTPTLTPTPTDKPLGGDDPSPTPTDTPEATSTPTPTSSESIGGDDNSTSMSTPTPTTRLIAQISPTPGGLTLPDAGISTPTLFGISLGALMIIAALLLAI